MKIRIRTAAMVSAAAIVFPFVTVQACGPDFTPDTFVRTQRPDDLRGFGEGKLGILQAGYDSNELAVAYRYLNGGKLSSTELSIYAPGPARVIDYTKMNPQQIAAARAAEEDAPPVTHWTNTRKRYADGMGAPMPPTTGLPAPGGYYDPGALACPEAAFRTAALTLTSRAGRWGDKSPWLADWIAGQDAVFSHCSGKSAAMPAAAPAQGPELLREDRAYQTAAAEFYAGDFDAARSGFEAIAEDKDSPWQPWGRYLAARAVVRKAFAMGKSTDPWSQELADFDMATMQTAEKMLEDLVKHPEAGLAPGAALHELDFVRMRTEPDARAAEICAALGGPKPDANFKQDLDDLNYILYHQIKLKTVPPLLEWIAAIRGHEAGGAGKRWRETRALPWLVAALMEADAGAASTPDLLQGAEAVGAGSPGFETVAFHRARLLMGLQNADRARGIVDSVLETQARQPGSDRNAFLGERMAVARSFDEFLKYAPRVLLEGNSEGYFAAAVAYDCSQVEADGRCAARAHLLEFDADAARVLNRMTPLDKLVEAAASAELPANLRREVALAAWTRSVVLGDAGSAGKLAALLPEPIQRMAGESVGFPAILTILRNPGLRPYVEPGLSRLDSFAKLDDYRNNWWCNDWTEQRQAEKDEGGPAVPYLSQEEQRRGAAEYKRIFDLPCAPAFLGGRVIEYAKDHPADPNVAEALALVVRATRYPCLAWGKYGPDEQSQKEAAAQNSAMSKEAFLLLHKEYPTSAWTAKTKYFY